MHENAHGLRARRIVGHVSSRQRERPTTNRWVQVAPIPLRLDIPTVGLGETRTLALRPPARYRRSMRQHSRIPASTTEHQRAEVLSTFNGWLARTFVFLYLGLIGYVIWFVG